ncbi:MULTISPECIES: XVIPCD domain-containing protein [Stenotrophomonas]|uniref:XVIPCD domain-containing protein n=1 Tax=Stenotrophomonas TaxID=40323 RepID=UPI000C26AE0D|nr:MULTISPECIES: XVIPCD domain-containing protein [Stenotrophomonas]HDS1146632.1 hypothetical protein [Stenotrophomonas maltophilia]HDS1162489.1 hypothetical protein [Stenotrophomonas maltophilia]
MSGLSQKDLDVLRFYQDKGNRELYFNYLAQKEGNDGYGLLALGVVRNDNVPGAVANSFAANQARQDGVRLGSRDWQAVGIDLIRNDFALREEYVRNGQPDVALNLREVDIRDSHDPIFENRGISADAWTPRQLLEAARRKGGSEEAEKIWSMMLDNRWMGVARGMGTLAAVAERYEDAEFRAAPYVAAMAQARAGVGVVDPHAHQDPDRIVMDGKEYTFHREADVWRGPARIESRISIKLEVSDPAIIQTLNEEREVRLEREQLRMQFHPDDPHRDRPLMPSPRLFSAEDIEPGRPQRLASDPTSADHPRHALYQQCATGVRAVDASLGRAWDAHSACMAASLTTLAARHGLERVDHVVLSQATPQLAAGANVFVVQGALADPTQLRAHMPTQEAIAQAPERSFQQLQDIDLQRSQQLSQQREQDEQLQQARSSPLMHA